MAERRHLRIAMFGLFSILSAGLTVPLRAQAVEAGAGTVRGRVRSGSGGAPVRGLSVVVQGTGLAAQTDASGRYVLAPVPAGERLLVFRLLGYEAQFHRVLVAPGAVTTLDVSLALEPVALSEIVVEAASRTPERIVEAPAAVAVADPGVVRDLAITGQPPLILGAMPGVDIVQSGMWDFNVNARGLNNFNQPPRARAPGRPRPDDPAGRSSLGVARDGDAARRVGSRGAGPRPGLGAVRSQRLRRRA
jgi:hypothetical protein